MKLSNTQKNILRFAGIRIAGFAINVLLKTVRITIENFDSVKKLESENKNYVFAFWHGSMLLGWYINRNKNFASLVSRSKDGDVLDAILRKWKYNVVRGSSHTGGKEALETMVDLARQKYCLAITPDGPTGPIFKMKAGAIIVSKRANVPLILSGIGIKRKWILKSWDRFEIPKPFTKIIVFVSDPIWITGDKTNDEIDSLIKDCEKRLIQLNKEALEKC